MTTGFSATAFVEQLNRAWQQADWVLLSEMYHPNAVLMPPDLGESLLGRKAILQTYQDFTAQATLHEFVATGTQAHAFSHCHILHNGFEAEYTVAGQRSRDTGTEIYVIEHSGAAHAAVIVWRQQIIHSTQSV